MNITSAPTPEADAAVEAWAITLVPVVRLEVARRLEGERDEARRLARHYRDAWCSARTMAPSAHRMPWEGKE